MKRGLVYVVGATQPIGYGKATAMTMAKGLWFIDLFTEVKPNVDRVVH